MNYEQKYLKYKSKYLEIKNQANFNSLLGGVKYSVGDIVEFKHEGKIVEITNSSENISYKIQFFDTISQSNKNVLIFEDKILSKIEQPSNTLKKTSFTSSKAYVESKGININDDIPEDFFDFFKNKNKNTFTNQIMQYYSIKKWDDLVGLNRSFNPPTNEEQLIIQNLELYFDSIKSTSEAIMPTSTQLILASQEDQTNLNNFLTGLLYINKYNLVKAGRIDADKKPLEMNGILIKINTQNYFQVFAIRYGNYDDEQIQLGLTYLTEYNLKELDIFNNERNKISTSIKNKEIKKNEYKYIIIGSLSGEINRSAGKNSKNENNKFEIFIDKFDAGALPRGGGNNMLCLFINYLKNFNESYKNSIFNVELRNTNSYNFNAYKKMGFNKCNNCVNSSTTMQLDIDKFNTKCKDFNNSVTLYT